MYSNTFFPEESHAFGKDEGLVHEAVVTGRKVGAGVRFWTALAESPKTFESIVPLVLHGHIIEKYNLGSEVPSDEAIVEFGAWLRKVCPEGCITCTIKPENMGIEKPEGFEAKPPEQQQRIVQILNEDALDDFRGQMAKRMLGMSLHPAEFEAIFVGAWKYDDIGVIHANNQCISVDDVMTAIQQLRIQRRFLVGK